MGLSKKDLERLEEIEKDSENLDSGLSEHDLARLKILEDDTKGVESDYDVALDALDVPRQVLTKAALGTSDPIEVAKKINPGKVLDVDPLSPDIGEDALSDYEPTPVSVMGTTMATDPLMIGALAGSKILRAGSGAIKSRKVQKIIRAMGNINNAARRERAERAAVNMVKRKLTKLGDDGEKIYGRLFGFKKLKAGEIVKKEKGLIPRQTKRVDRIIKEATAKAGDDVLIDTEQLANGVQFKIDKEFSDLASTMKESERSAMNKAVEERLKPLRELNRTVERVDIEPIRPDFETIGATDVGSFGGTRKTIKKITVNNKKRNLKSIETIRNVQKDINARIKDLDNAMDIAGQIEQKALLKTQAEIRDFLHSAIAQVDEKLADEFVKHNRVLHEYLNVGDALERRGWGNVFNKESAPEAAADLASDVVNRASFNNAPSRVSAGMIKKAGTKIGDIAARAGEALGVAGDIEALPVGYGALQHVEPNINVDNTGREPQSIDQQSLEQLPEELIKLKLPRNTEELMQNKEAVKLKVAQVAPDYYEKFIYALEEEPDKLPEVFEAMSMVSPQSFNFDKYERFDGKVPKVNYSNYVRDLRLDKTLSSTDLIAKINQLYKNGRGEYDPQTD